MFYTLNLVYDAGRRVERDFFADYSRWSSNVALRLGNLHTSYTSLDALCGQARDDIKRCAAAESGFHALMLEPEFGWVVLRRRTSWCLGDRGPIGLRGCARDASLPFLALVLSGAAASAFALWFLLLGPF